MCKETFENGDFYVKDAQPYCREHYLEAFAPKCSSCAKPIEGSYVGVGGKPWHSECFRCTNCGGGLEAGYIEHEGGVYDGPCFKKLFRPDPPCTECGEPVASGAMEDGAGNVFHKHCFCCNVCKEPLADVYLQSKGQRFCAPCYEKRNPRPKCVACDDPITDSTFVKVQDKTYHSGCFQCSQCLRNIANEQFAAPDGVLYCVPCFRQRSDGAKRKNGLHSLKPSA